MATVTISSQVTELKWAKATPPRLRIYAVIPFLTADGVPVHAGNPAAGLAYFDSACTLDGSNRVVAPAVTLPSTTDSMDKPDDARYSAYLYSVGADGASQYQEFSVFSASFALDHSDTSQTWEDVRAFNLDTLPASTPHSAAVGGNFAVGGNIAAGGSGTFGGGVSAPNFSGNLTGNINGSTIVSGNVSAAQFIGSAALLTGIPGTPSGAAFESLESVGSGWVDYGTGGAGTEAFDFLKNGSPRMRLTSDNALALYGLSSAPAVAGAGITRLYHSNALRRLFVSSDGSAYSHLLTSADLGWFNVLDYGASGVEATTTGSITAGTNQLTLADPSTYREGQGLLIEDGLTGSLDLVTSIVTLVGAVATLADNATADVTGGMVRHDDSAAFQTAINAAFAAGGGVVYCPRGVYYLCGPLDATENAVLCIPRVNNGNQARTIVFQGEFAAPTTSAGPAATSGTVWICDRVVGSGTNPALITGRASSNTTLGSFSFVLPIFRDIFMRANPDPSVSLVQMHNQMGLIMDGCQLDAGDWASQLEPTHADSYAVIAPGILNYAQIKFNNVSVLGAFYNGVYCSEHAEFSGTYITRCKNGLVLEDMGLAIKSVGLSFSSCNKAIKQAGARAFFTNFNVIIERYETGISGPAQWYSASTTAEIDRGSGQMYGTLNVMLEVGGVGGTTGRIYHNIPTTVNTLRIVRSNAGAHFNCSDLVLGKTQPTFYLQTEDGGNRNTLAAIPSGSHMQGHLSANAYHVPGVGWVRGNATVAGSSVDLILDPTTGGFTVQNAASGTGAPSFIERLKVTTPGAGETSLWLYNGDTSALVRVKVGASGTGPGGSGRALYLA